MSDNISLPHHIEHIRAWRATMTPEQRCAYFKAKGPAPHKYQEHVKAWKKYKYGMRIKCPDYNGALTLERAVPQGPIGAPTHYVWRFDYVSVARAALNNARALWIGDETVEPGECPEDDYSVVHKMFEERVRVSAEKRARLKTEKVMMRVAA